MWHDDYGYDSLGLGPARRSPNRILHELGDFMYIIGLMKLIDYLLYGVHNSYSKKLKTPLRYYHSKGKDLHPIFGFVQFLRFHILLGIRAYCGNTVIHYYDNEGRSV